MLYLIQDISYNTNKYNDVAIIMCIYIICNIRELTYDLKKPLTVTSYYFSFSSLLTKPMALSYIKFVFCFLFLT